MNLLRRFGVNDGGNVTIIAAISIVPVLLAAGSAIDYIGANRLETSLQSAVDAAALAAAASPSDETSIKSALAATFLHNTAEFEATIPDVTVAEDRVTVSATAIFPTSFMKLAGLESIPVNVTATATAITKPVCLLALNKTAPGAINLYGSTASITAQDCVVHSNSASATGLANTSGAMSTADVFCSTGGYAGTKFDPLPKTNCRAVKDPYAGLPVPDVSGCDFTNVGISAGTVNLYPGVYCGGLSISGGTANFAPGLYVMKDGSFKGSSSTTNIYGSEVTFYFYGDKSNLEITGGAVTDLSAPKTGPYAGLVFVQYPGNGGGSLNKITGHSDTKIIGAGYFPTQKLSIGGSGNFGVKSPYMSFVADELQFHGNGKITLSFDAAAAGFTNPGPREYWGTRLVK